MSANSYTKQHRQPSNNTCAPVTDQLSVCKVMLRFSTVSPHMPSIQKDRKLCVLFLLSGGGWAFITPPTVPKSPIRPLSTDGSVTHCNTDNSLEKKKKKMFERL